MQREILPCGPTPHIHLEKIPGNLQIAGWDREELSAKSDAGEINIQSQENEFKVQCDGDLILYIPQQAQLSIGIVSDDMDLRGISGNIYIQSVRGDLQVRSVGQIEIGHISGDINLRHANGNCTITHVAGDASLTQVVGRVSIHGVGGDLYLRQVQDEINASAGGDVIVFIIPREHGSYRINAGSDVLLRLPADASVVLGMNAREVRVDPKSFEQINEENQEVGFGPRQITLGSGATNMHLNAGGSIRLTSRAEEWSRSVPDRGNEFNFPGVPPIPPIPPVPPVPPIPPIPDLPFGLGSQLESRINERIARKMEHTNRKIAEANQRIAEQTARRAEAAARRAEQKVRSAETRGQLSLVLGGRRPINIGFQGNPVPRPEPVSDDERLMILKMLQEKKITLQEAEKLLAALEGK